MKTDLALAILMVVGAALIAFATGAEIGAWLAF